MHMQYLCACVCAHLIDGHMQEEGSPEPINPPHQQAYAKQNIAESFTGPVWITVGTHLSSYF